jgi:predicted CoA-binding protein
MVGASMNWKRPSNFVMKYLTQKGYHIVPVNKNVAGEQIYGQTVYQDLASITETVDMVDMFRPAKEATQLVEDSIKLGVKVFWMQLEIRNDDAAKLAEDAGMTVVMNRCPKIEYARLFGELGWNGFNTGVITTKRRRF